VQKLFTITKPGKNVLCIVHKEAMGWKWPVTVQQILQFKKGQTEAQCLPWHACKWGGKNQIAFWTILPHFLLACMDYTPSYTVYIYAPFPSSIHFTLKIEATWSLNVLVHIIRSGGSHAVTFQNSICQLFMLRYTLLNLTTKHRFTCTL